MTQLYTIVVGVDTITTMAPGDVLPGPIRYTLVATGEGEPVEISVKVISARQVTFEDVPAGYYLVLAQRLDTDGKELGAAHLKEVQLDDSIERTYEAIASISATGYQQKELDI